MEDEATQLSDLKTNELIVRARELTQSNLQLAELYLARALQLDPDNREAIDLQGYVYYGLECFEQSREFNERAIRLDPSNAYAHNGLGNCLTKLGRFEESLAYFKKAIELADDSFVDPFYDIAVTLYEKGRNQEAGEFLNRGCSRLKTFAQLSRQTYESIRDKPLL